LGQWPASFWLAQSEQKVHSKEQIMAAVDSGGISLLQHSQLGRKESMFKTPDRKGF
jgi:hypothetical protein